MMRIAKVLAVSLLLALVSRAGSPDAVVVPAVDFQATPIGEAVRELDVIAQNSGLSIRYIGDDTRPEPTVTVSLRQLPLSAALHYTCAAASAELGWRQTATGIVVAPPAQLPAVALETRRFNANWNSRFYGLEPTAMFSTFGVDWPEGASASLVENWGPLTCTNTPQALDRIAEVLDAMWRIQTQVACDVQIIRLSASAVAALPLDRELRWADIAALPAADRTLVHRVSTTALSGKPAHAKDTVERTVGERKIRSTFSVVATSTIATVPRTSHNSEVGIALEEYDITRDIVVGGASIESRWLSSDRSRHLAVLRTEMDGEKPVGLLLVVVTSRVVDTAGQPIRSLPETLGAAPRPR